MKKAVANLWGCEVFPVELLEIAGPVKTSRVHDVLPFNDLVPFILIGKEGWLTLSEKEKGSLGLQKLQGCYTTQCFIFQVFWYRQSTSMSFNRVWEQPLLTLRCLTQGIVWHMEIQSLLESYKCGWPVNRVMHLDTNGVYVLVFLETKFTVTPLAFI